MGYKLYKMSKLRTDASTYSLDVEDFIAEVKKYPVVWDLNCEDNRYKTKKQAAWGEIAKKFILDFDNLPDLEKMDVYRRLHSKWRNIRDSYVRHIKRRESKRGYMYARHLSFLNNLYNHVAYSTDDDDNENEGSEEDPLQRPKRRFEHNDSAWPSDTDDVSTVDLKRRRIKQPAIEIEPYDPGRTYRQEDEDKSFFESLLPAVRGFNLDQKLEFRSEVLTLVKNIRRSVITGTIKSDPTEDEFD